VSRISIALATALSWVILGQVSCVQRMPEELEEDQPLIATCLQNPSGSVNWNLSTTDCDPNRNLITTGNNCTTVAGQTTCDNTTLQCGAQDLDQTTLQLQSADQCEIQGPSCNANCGGSRADDCTNYCLTSVLPDNSWCQSSICQTSLCSALCGCGDFSQYIIGLNMDYTRCPFFQSITDTAHWSPNSCMESCAILAENLTQFYGLLPTGSQYQPTCCDANDQVGISNICAGMCNNYQNPKQLISPSPLQFTGAIQVFTDQSISCLMPADIQTRWSDSRVQNIISTKVCEPISDENSCNANIFCNWSNNACVPQSTVQWWSCPADVDEDGDPLNYCVSDVQVNDATCYACFSQDQTSNFCPNKSDPTRCKITSALNPSNQIDLGTLGKNDQGFCTWSTDRPQDDSQSAPVNCASIGFPQGGGASCGDNLSEKTCKIPADSQGPLCQWAAGLCSPTNTWVQACKNKVGCAWDDNARACLTTGEEAAFQANFNNGYLPMGNGWWCPQDLGKTPGQTFKCAANACVVEAPQALRCGRCIPGSGTNGLCL
jgi:hypothetical protein